MIDRLEILSMANALNINPHVIEKDYVLGWLLWGTYNNETVRESWLFKGGTCLKKCFFETFRFSEDLDFTLTDATHVDEEFLRLVFEEISNEIYGQTSIEIPPDLQRFEIYKNPRGHKICNVRIAYRGPVAPRGKNIPRVKFDITADELIVLPSVLSQVAHPYSDVPSDGVSIHSYSYEEAFVEKIRALAERSSPRDVYDLINLFRNIESHPKYDVLLNTLSQKCEFKGVDLPALDQLDYKRTLVEDHWNTMLGHQLPILPSLSTYWRDLPAFFHWLESGLVPSVPASYVGEAGEQIVRAYTKYLPVKNRTKSCLEMIRFAATNWLCVDINYQESISCIEPYSLRCNSGGQYILYGYNVDKSKMQTYLVERIKGVTVTDQAFNPRFAVELTPRI